MQPWPTGETRLSMEQRMELQTLLIQQGHLEGEVDGIIGSGTLEGVRSYQRAKGLPVDGYPTQTILTMLRAETPPPPPPAPAAQAVPTGAVPQPAPAPAAAPAAPAAPAAQGAPQSSHPMNAADGAAPPAN